MSACDARDGGWFCAKPLGHDEVHESCGGRRWGDPAAVLSHDPVYGWEPSIPEPFWVRRWFRWCPACYPCRVTLRDRAEHDEHWIRTHQPDGDSEPAR